MRTFATLTKMTAKGLSTWSFVECDGVLIGFGGTTNRCRVFRSHQQMQECIINFVGYGYQLASKTAKPVAKPTKVAKRPAKPEWDTPVPVAQAEPKTLTDLVKLAAAAEPTEPDATETVVAAPLF